MRKIVISVSAAAFLIAPVLVLAATNEEIIAQIQAQIAQIQAQILQVLSGSIATPQPQPAVVVPSSSGSVADSFAIRPPLAAPAASDDPFRGTPVARAARRPVLEMTIPDINSRYQGGDPYLFGVIKSVDDSRVTMSVFLSSMMNLTVDVSGAAHFSGRYDDTDQVLSIPATVEIPPVNSVVVAFMAQSDAPFTVSRFQYIDGSYLIPLYGRIQSVDVAGRSIRILVLNPTLSGGGFQYARDFSKEIGFLQNFPLLAGKVLTFYVPTYARITQEMAGGVVGPAPFKNLTAGSSIVAEGFRIFGDTLVIKAIQSGSAVR